jgi:hypothetical protein
LRAEFNRQLADYLARLRPVFSGGAVGMADLVRHAEWTVLVFTRRASYSEIAKRWPGLRHGRYEDPETAVFMAVKRFAARIGLTLPRRRKNI